MGGYGTGSTARPALTESRRADVVVIGGGFTGLSAALALAERGIDTVLLEANAIGWGASGRNGGQVIPGLKYDPETLRQRYGQERGRRWSNSPDAMPMWCSN
ncbi:NAD(P)/FAD-dependent oxidoreductase [Billgrantia tianxiuensis]|uniref:NAD(P)/FAD-dependent oxidoreductase n=1 Tax=Billgrantia tianxiuensis TaxID=2497861 RepID=UPI001915AECD|nr:FAD-binding oxidoreductase [Halomonas tianxiuensis]